jgi:small GTP-binding protein
VAIRRTDFGEELLAMPKHRLLVALLIAALGLAAAAWLVVSLRELHDRLAPHSAPLAVGVVAAAVVVVAACGLAAARLIWRMGHPQQQTAQAPSDVIKAAEVQAEKAEAVVNQLVDPAVKARLGQELATIKSAKDQQEFHVVVFGTGSAGKTSLINALLGQTVGRTEATLGTTRHGETHVRTLEGVEGKLILTDTPGLSEIGTGGATREAEARDLAARADLLLFVVDHDLTRSEFDPLAALARQGKRSIVVLNKKDRFVDADRTAILAKLRQRLDGVVSAQDVVASAAAPRPTLTRFQTDDGSIQTVLEAEPPDLDDLEERIEAILNEEGDALRAGNLLLRAHLVSRQAQDQLTKERRNRAIAVVDRFQWITAATAFTNPIPALDLMATGAVQFQMISEIAAVYGVELSTNHVRMIGGQMIQMLLKLGMIEAATSLIAGLFKSSFVGYAAGGAVQATTMAYLTHVSGLTFFEYFERGQSWGDGGMQAALVRQFDLNRRADFLQEFAKQAVDRVVRKLAGSAVASRQGS